MIADPGAASQRGRWAVGSPLRRMPAGGVRRAARPASIMGIHAVPLAVIHRADSWIIGALLAASIMLSGCAEKLIPTPYVMRGEEGRAFFEALPEARRTADIPVLYFTDRAAERESARGVEYGYGRARDSEFGIARVSLSPEPTWEQLVADSTSGERSRSYTVKLESVERAGALASMMTYLEARDGGLAMKHGTREALQADQARFDEMIARFIGDQSGGGQVRREALVFVHGYNNTFEDGVTRLAQAWHCSGRQGVPIVYSWPAGSGGLKGYAYDRESGEYTIVHLKRLLLALAKCPHIERVHILSHSRGTDVATTALRELNAELRGVTGRSLFTELYTGGPPPLPPESNGVVPTPADLLKLETLILAAPDLDFEVFVQRFFGENMIRAARRVVVYFSDEDEALGLAQWLFRSRRRLGAMRIEDFKPEQRALIGQVSQLELINCEVTGYTSHSYILQHPAALSDVILLLRDGRAAGAENGRPLEPLGGLWQLTNDYMKGVAE